MASLAEEIARLTDPAPVSHDPEDIDDVTRARVPFTSADNDVDDGVTNACTSIRRRAATLLVDEDSRYAGKKVTRWRLKKQGALANLDSDSVDSLEAVTQEKDESEEEIGSEEDESEEEGEDESEDEDDSEGESEDELTSFKNKMNVKLKEPKSSKSTEFSFEDDGDYSKFEEPSDDDAASELEDDDEDEDEDEDASGGDQDNSDETEEGGISKFSTTKVDEEVKKGEATKIQLTLWDQLLKARIELQKVLLLVNQLPQPDTWPLFVHAGGSEFNAALVEGQGAVKSVLDKMFFLQLCLSLQHPDTKGIVQDGKKSLTPTKKPVTGKDDEDITSESDAEDEDAQGLDTAAMRKLKRKYPLGEYPELLAKRHKVFTPYRNDTIQKWFDKTRVATGKLNKGFSAFEQSALKQIRQILSDRDRLVKRTQLKRSIYRVLGKPELRDDVTNTEQNAPGSDDVPKPELHDRLKEYDAEIFDDDDFYHQLLRELIERKSMDTNDPVALSRQWLQLQKLRSKVKRKVDTRASKGRKIRYDILPKLVNFMAPNDTSPWTNEARDELYSSLFGKRNPELQALAS